MIRLRIYSLEVEKLSPKDNEIMVKVMATTVSARDWRIPKPDPTTGKFFNGLFKPMRIHILGVELAREVEAVGRDMNL